jgi:hypothetical protein
MNMKANISIADALRVIAEAKPEALTKAVSDFDGIDEITSTLEGTRMSLAVIGEAVCDRCASDEVTDLRDAAAEEGVAFVDCSNHVKDALYELATSYYVEAITSTDLTFRGWPDYEECIDGAIVEYTSEHDKTLLVPSDFEPIKRLFIENVLDLS